MRSRTQENTLRTGGINAMTAERNKLYETLRKWHVPAGIAYKIVVRAVA